jgi:hypothetical protein
MTGSAVEARNTFSPRSADDVEQMTVPVIALLRIVRGSVAINTARIGQDGVDLLPGCETRFARHCRRTCVLGQGKRACPHKARDHNDYQGQSTNRSVGVNHAESPLLVQSFVRRSLILLRPKTAGKVAVQKGHDSVSGILARARPRSRAHLPGWPDA